MHSTEQTAQTAPQASAPLGTQHIPVHKKDAEGILLIDRLTGMVVTDQDDRPEWAIEAGLVCAQLAEHTLWLTNTFGPDFASAHSFPDMFAYEALGWLTFTSPDGESEGVEGYIEADAEHRMEIVATALGIDRSEVDIDKAFANVPGIVASVEIARDNTRTDAEMQDFRTAQEGRFEVIEGGASTKTGTHG